MKRWSKDEDNILIEYYGKLTSKNIQQQYLNERTKSAIECRINRILERSKTIYKPKIVDGKKVCKDCGIDKPLCEFVESKGSQNGRAHRCKICEKLRLKLYSETYREHINERKRVYHRDHPEKRKDYYRKNRKDISDKKKLKHAEYIKKCIIFKGSKCQECGLKTDFYEVYDFHHTNPEDKSFQISLGRSKNWEKEVIPELKKCTLLCRNCHTLLTYNLRRAIPAITYRQKYIRSKTDENKERCVQYLGNICQICGLVTSDYMKYDFHHIDANSKLFDISKRATSDWDSVIKPELNKCVLLCGNCHRSVTYGRYENHNFK